MQDNSDCISLCDLGGNAKTRKFDVIVPHILQPDVDVQLSVVVYNLVLGAAKEFIVSGEGRNCIRIDFAGK